MKLTAELEHKTEHLSEMHYMLGFGTWLDVLLQQHAAGTILRS